MTYLFNVLLVLASLALVTYILGSLPIWLIVVAFAGWLIYYLDRKHGTRE